MGAIGLKGPLLFIVGAGLTFGAGELAIIRPVAEKNRELLAAEVETLWVKVRTTAIMFVIKEFTC